MLLRVQQEQGKLFEQSNRGQNVENENAFSQNAIWCAIDNSTYPLEDENKFTWNFGRYENLCNTDCAN